MKLELQSVLEQRRQNNKLKTDNILPVPWVEFKDTYEKAFAEIDPYKTDYLAISAGNSFSSKVKGQNELDDQSVIYDFAGPGKKVVLTLYHQWYHFLLDTLVYVYQAWKYDKDIKFIFIEDLKHSQYFEEKLMPFLLKFLNHFNITNYSFIKREAFQKNPVLLINNYYYEKLEFGSDIYWMCNEFIKDMYPDDDAEPFRKVYISRRKNYVKRSDDQGFVQQEGFDVSRVGNEEAVEDYFKKYNWEIMYPEDFDSIDDQVKYLRETKYLMGASSAGLINACFMKPGTNLVELLTTIHMLKAGEHQTQFHVLYTVMCWSLSIFHASIPNIKNELALFEFIESNKHAKELIQNT
jgi:hypothetical protein